MLKNRLGQGVMAAVIVLASAITLTLGAPATPAHASGIRVAVLNYGFADVSVTNCDGRGEEFRVNSSSGAVDHRYQTSYNGPWSGWYTLGGTLLYNMVTAYVGRDCKIEIFGVGTNRQMYTMWQLGPNGAGGWSGWANIGGEFLRGPDAYNFYMGDNLLAAGVCAVGLDNDPDWCNHHTTAYPYPWTGWHKHD
jgi:hypothetical protein